jgi:Leucine-rich repeat (LRR) protein
MRLTNLLRTLRWERHAIQDASNLIGLNLTHLDIRSHTLVSLSDDLVASFTNLTTLNLTNGKLTALPDSFATLQQLRHLYLRNNKFTLIPEVLLSLIHLESLDLCFNSIEGLLDERIGEMSSLCALGLARNKITVLPNSLGRLKLKVLLLTGNPLEYSSQEVVDQGLDAIMKTLTGEAQTQDQQHILRRSDLESKARLLDCIKGCIFGQL